MKKILFTTGLLFAALIVFSQGLPKKDTLTGGEKVRLFAESGGNKYIDVQGIADFVTTGPGANEHGRILYVSTEGDNSTAVVGDPHSPFRDPWAARDSAVAGDVIYVFPGEWTMGDLGEGTDYELDADPTVDEYSLVKSGITYYGAPGATLTNLAGGDIAIFQHATTDTILGDSTLNLNILGHWTFNADSSRIMLIDRDTGLVNIKFEADILNLHNRGYNGLIVRPVQNLDVNIKEIYTDDARAQIYTQGSIVRDDYYPSNINIRIDNIRIEDCINCGVGDTGDQGFFHLADGYYNSAINVEVGDIYIESDGWKTIAFLPSNWVGRVRGTSTNVTIGSIVHKDYGLISGEYSSYDLSLVFTVKPYDPSGNDAGNALFVMYEDVEFPTQNSPVAFYDNSYNIKVGSIIADAALYDFRTRTWNGTLDADTLYRDSMFNNIVNFDIGSYYSPNGHPILFRPNEDLGRVDNPMKVNVNIENGSVSNGIALWEEKSEYEETYINGNFKVVDGNYPVARVSSNADFDLSLSGNYETTGDTSVIYIPTGAITSGYNIRNATLTNGGTQAVIQSDVAVTVGVQDVVMDVTNLDSDVTLQGITTDNSGDISAHSYPNTRDDSGTTFPTNFTYTDANGNLLSTPTSVLGIGATGLKYSPGAVLFADTDSTITEDKPNLFFDDSTDRLFIGSNPSDYSFGPEGGLTQDGLLLGVQGKADWGGHLLMQNNPTDPAEGYQVTVKGNYSGAKGFERISYYGQQGFVNSWLASIDTIADVNPAIFASAPQKAAFSFYTREQATGIAPTGIDNLNIFQISNFTEIPYDCCDNFFTVKANGDLNYGLYPNTRDDSGTTAPINFTYTDADGNLLAAPIAGYGGIYSGSGTLDSTTLVTIPSDSTLTFNGGEVFINPGAVSANLFGGVVAPIDVDLIIGDSSLYGQSEFLGPAHYAYSDKTSPSTNMYSAASSNANAPFFQSYRYRGNLISPQPVDSSDVLGTLQFLGGASAGAFTSKTAGKITSIAMETFDASNTKSIMEFAVGGDAGSVIKALTLRDVGISSSLYPNTRDDSGTTAPTNFFYSDGDGNLLSAPTSALTSTYGYMAFADSTYTLSMTGGGTFDPITNGTNTLFGNEVEIGDLTVQGDSSIIATTGIYEIVFDTSFDGANTSTYEFAVMVDGVAETYGKFERDMSSGNTGSGSLIWVGTLTAGEVVKIGVAETAGTTDITLIDANFSIELK